MASASRGHSKANGHARGIGPDGIPRLPPIQRPAKQDDPYANSKLMTFRVAKHKEDLLKHIIFENAMKALEDTQEYNENQPEPDTEPQFPKEMMSKDRRVRLNYQFMKKCVESAPITKMQNELIENILARIPDKLKSTSELRESIAETLVEIRADFDNSMKKSNVQLKLVKPAVGGLEDDDNVPAPEEPEGVDYSSPWHDDFVANKEMIRQNLHILHPSMQSILNMCQQTLGGQLLVDCSGYRSQGPMEFESLRNNVILECERSEERLMSSWLPSVINVFADKKNFASVRSDKLDSFYTCVSTLISNQIKDLLGRTVEAWVSLFDESHREKLPLLKMELVYDEGAMQFYPLYDDLEEVVLYVVDQITKMLQSVPTVQSWLAGGNNTLNVDARVADHIVNSSYTKLKEAVKRNFEEPKAHLQWFVDKYSYLINGEAQAEATEYMSKEHTFAEDCE